MMRSFTTSWFMRLYTILYLHFGDPHWWPGETPFEVAVGAVLTQNTSWKNVEQAIINLDKEGMLDPKKMDSSKVERIADLVHPAGYHNQKAAYLKVLSDLVVKELEGDIEKLSDLDTDIARRKLLGLNGIGNETADSILCYAVSKPVFVVDSYTKRILSRLDPFHYLEVATGKEPEYMTIRSLVMTNLKGDVQLYNRLHALLIILAKENCRKRPLCDMCPLGNICYTGMPSSPLNE